MRRLLLLLFVFLAAPLAAAEKPSPQALVQMLDYMAVDYGGAVQAGRVIDAGEYEEMVEFSQAVLQQVESMPAGVRNEAEALVRAVDGRAPAEQVAGLTTSLRKRIIADHGVATVPTQAPDLQRAKALFTEQCTGCHGAAGQGDGPLGVGMVPPPIDFTDPERAGQRSLFGLYNTITLGVPETAMEGYGSLSEAERWSLAFYVGGLAFEAGPAKAGAATLDLQQVATLSPNEVPAEQRAAFLALRADPAALFAEASPLTVAAERLRDSLTAYRSGDRQSAYTHAVAAYLDGFELAEASVAVAAPALSEEIEEAMAAYRQAVQSGAAVEAVATRAQHIDTLLDDARAAADARGLSSGEAFSGALVILLREGLEAILVVAALGAFLLKTGRRDALRYLHAGWILALLGGVATWWGATHLFTFSGEGRELTEGIAALVAAAVLFYVGFWLHSKSHSVKWRQFVEGSVTRALARSTLWSLAGLSFIAVYREAFETILFYQALWLQADVAGQQAVLGGALTAAVALAVLGWLVIRTSTRLPLRRFFGATGALMFVLAVVFAGKGIAAFQEAGKLPVSPVELLPTIDLLGLYPNLESVGIQLTMVVTGAGLLYWQRRRQLAEAAAA